jgi:hypothetical protein
MLVGRTAGAAAHLIQSLRQTLGLMHFNVQQYRLWIGRFTIDQLIAGSVSAFGGAMLNEAARGHMRRGLADVCAYADSINRHASSLAPPKKTESSRSDNIHLGLLRCSQIRANACHR